METEKVAAQFKKGIKNHAMKVMLDADLHRHIRFQQPDTNDKWFEIVTWPGHLAVAGDMGCWVFSRMPDMFEFFRSEALEIEPQYWSEKIQSSSKFEGPEKKWSADLFADMVEKAFKDRIEDSEWADKKDEIWENVNEDILIHDNEHEAMLALRDYDYEGFTFGDEWYYNDGKEWSFHFLWCLYAIVWAIQQYDAAKVGLAA
jgi:hypothetical protein